MQLNQNLVGRLVCVVLIFYAIGLFAQTPVDTFSSHLKNSLTSYYKKYPAEKIFVHTSQGVYCAGETIWYKVYTLAYGKPSALSKIVYVRLTDTAGNVIVQNNLQLKLGVAHGNFDLDKQLKTGWYQLNAFTSWMMNFGAEGYYRQRIFIQNLADKTSTSDQPPARKKVYHINFYPEGGDLVDGYISKIAFKAYGDDGVPAKVEGVIKDNTGSVIAAIATVHDGMGSFKMEGVAGNTYTASVQFPDGTKQELKLPVAQQSGICLQATQDDATILVKLGYTGPASKYENCTIAAFQNNGQVSVIPVKLTNGINEFEVKKTGFSTGILRLTVFDGDHIPRAERLLFINKHDVKPASIKTDMLSFTPGGYNSFTAELKNESGQPVNGNFSVSVTDAAAIDKSPAQNIFSALLLSPELRGDVNGPAYYFRNPNDSLSHQLDLVMLTNGWRHFVWQKVLNEEKLPLTHQLEKTQYFAGKIDGYQPPSTRKDKSQLKILMTHQDSGRFIGYITPDSAGRFAIKDFNHSGLSDIYIQWIDKRGRAQKSKKQLFPTLADSLKHVNGQPFKASVSPVLNKYHTSFAKEEIDAADFKNGGIMLKTVDIKAAKLTPTQKIIKEHVSPLYQSGREYTLDLVNTPFTSYNLLNFVRGKFPGLQFFEMGDQVDFTYRGNVTFEKPKKPSLPYCYLNEVSVEFNAIKDIDLSEIALIRFIPPPASFAPFNGGNIGALMVYTRKYSDQPPQEVRGMKDYDHLIFNGYSITREFKSPDYSKPGALVNNDNRVALYWNHDIDTDSQGTLRFQFYNSSHAKKFNVVIQGVDAQGKLVYVEQTF